MADELQPPCSWTLGGGNQAHGFTPRPAVHRRPQQDGQPVTSSGSELACVMQKWPSSHWISQTRQHQVISGGNNPGTRLRKERCAEGGMHDHEPQKQRCHLPKTSPDLDRVVALSKEDFCVFVCSARHPHGACRFKRKHIHLGALEKVIAHARLSMQACELKCLRAVPPPVQRCSCFTPPAAGPRPPSYGSSGQPSTTCVRALRVK